jgi:hypothetical protein
MNPAHIVDPFNITNFRRSDAELEAFALFSVAVAGKKADITSRGLARLLDRGEASLRRLEGRAGGPFQIIRHLHRWGLLQGAIKAAGLGQFRRLARAFAELSDRHVRALSLPVLESIHGVGPKTARFFLLHSYADVRVAALDVHILSALRALDVPDVPRDTPPAGPTYRRLEDEFLALAGSLRRDPAELDLTIWVARTKSRRSA